MYTCALIDFKNIYSFNHSLEKGDYIEDYVLKNDIDILFITNYINYSLYVDVENYNDNVFYSNLDGKYTIFKGSIRNKICNIILIKIKYNSFTLIKSYFNDSIIQPLIIVDNVSKVKLICFDQTNELNRESIIEKLLQDDIYTILAGSFKKDNMIHKYNNEILKYYNIYYGIIYKKMENIHFKEIYSKLFDKNIISFSCLEENTNFIKYYCYKLIRNFK